MLPNEGVGLARMEFIISEHIGIHPMALAQPDKVTSEDDRKAIAKLAGRYERPADFFIEKLSEGVGTIAAAFYPKPVIIRLSDFKTNEYAKLIGGAAFEPREETRCSASAARLRLCGRPRHRRQTVQVTRPRNNGWQARCPAGK